MSQDEPRRLRVDARGCATPRHAAESNPSDRVARAAKEGVIGHNMKIIPRRNLLEKFG